MFVFVLVLKQPLLSPKISTVTRKGTIATDHAVAGNNDADIVCAVRGTNSTDCFYITGSFRKFEVADGTAIRYILQRSPDLLAKRRAFLLQREIKAVSPAFKIFCQLLNAVRKQGGFFFIFQHNFRRKWAFF